MAQFEVLSLDKTNSRARAPGSGDSYLMPRSLAVGGETVTASSPVLDLSQSWNASGVTFTGIKFNVTDTASASGSLLMDLQVGGVSKFNVDKAGSIYSTGAIYSSNGLNLGTYYLRRSITDFAIFTTGENFAFGVGTPTGSPAGGYAYVGAAIGWLSGNYANSADLTLYRDAGNTLAQRNGINPQTFRLYRTYIDGSNRAYTAALQDATAGYILDSVNTGTASLPTNLLDLKLNGVSKFSVNASGVLNVLGLNVSGVSDLNNNALGLSNTGALYHYIQYQFDSGFDGVHIQGYGGVRFRHGATGSTLYWRAGLLAFNGYTASYPALKSSATAVQVRLADDSAFTNIQGKIQTHTNAVAETLTATHTITIYDATGTAYKVLAVAA